MRRYIFMKNLLLTILFFTFSYCIQAKEVQGVKAPACVGATVETVRDAKCIALFYGQFISVVGAFGEVWDVEAKLKGDKWFIYSKKPNGIAPEGTVLYIINKVSGEPIGGYKPKI